MPLELYGCILHFISANYQVGCSRKLSSVFRYNHVNMEEELARKKEQYNKHIEMKTFLKQCEMEKVRFRLELQAGSFSSDTMKIVAANAARDLGATWVILDREMKKKKQYFIENLSCGLSRIKRNCSIDLLRGPILRRNRTSILYDEMVPGETWEEFPSPFIPFAGKSKPNSLGLLEEGNIQTSSQGSGSRKSLYQMLEAVKIGDAERSGSINPSKKQKKHQGGRELFVEINGRDEFFKNYKCSVCNNRRPKMGWYRDFSYDELYEATNRFNVKNYLSEGGFGYVYKGELRNGLKIAVKQYKTGSIQGEKEFKAEVDVLKKARHQNLVTLLGSCSEGSRRLLVYEYVCNGSLDQHLAKNNETPLTWDKRIKVALGAAKGLEYLHSKNIIHRDMNSNNILITHDHEALLGDFGLAKVQHDESFHASNNSLVGTVGYLAPEYAESGELSTKTDVYSFGVVLLQIITGLPVLNNTLGDKSLIGWALPLLEEKNYPDLVDKTIMDSYDIHQLYFMVKVAEKCLSTAPDDRCTMKEIAMGLSDTIGEGDYYGLE
ncbi:hypothetical protein LIER_02151 [Lithospermum erythrorhizon]|uniref:Protein kinase domain-containing protein n=1 Tax=Lithospermum erythrorhizon TaxID=34254 RepID=A0AAV3NP41_LITER